MIADIAALEAPAAIAVPEAIVTKEVSWIKLDLSNQSSKHQGKSGRINSTVRISFYLFWPKMRRKVKITCKYKAYGGLINLKPGAEHEELMVIGLARQNVYD